MIPFSKIKVGETFKVSHNGESNSLIAMRIPGSKAFEGVNAVILATKYITMRGDIPYYLRYKKRGETLWIQGKSSVEYLSSSEDAEKLLLSINL